MASDDKKAKTNPGPSAKTNPVPSAKTNPVPSTESPSKDKSTSGAEPSKVDGGETAATTSPSGYSRGEGQKPVSKAYKENWNAIYGKKKR